MLHTNSPEVPNKSTIHLTDRQLKYLAARSQGMSRVEAVRAIGYSGAPSQIEKSENLRKALILSMEARGLSTDKLAQKIRDGVDAKKVQFSSFKGKIVDERIVDDNETQHKYVRTALEIRGDLSDGKEINMNLGIVQMPGSMKVEDWNQEPPQIVKESPQISSPETQGNDR